MYLLTFCFFLLILCIVLSSQYEFFITEDNIDRISIMANIYNKFIDKYSHLTIIQTLKVENDKYTILVYDKFRNLLKIFELHNGKYKEIKQFLLNEFDQDLNIPEKSKEISIKENIKYNHY